MKTTQEARAFFYERASWSQAQGETKHQGKTRCARKLAHAEAQGREAGLSFSWYIDPGVNSSDFNHTKPYYDLWACACRDAHGIVKASLCGIDFGRDGEPWSDPYRRVVEAELADEALTSARVAATPGGSQ